MKAARFTIADLEAANDAWGCNCGPGALAAICGLTLDEVRPHFGPAWPRYTNPTAMRTALRSIRTSTKQGVGWLELGATAWPGWGLCRIQWEGPWTQPGVYLIVSMVIPPVAAAQGRWRCDLLVPGEQVRDGAGRIVGCRSLARV